MRGRHLFGSQPYHQLGRRHRTEAIVEQLAERLEVPRRLALLGRVETFILEPLRMAERTAEPAELCIGGGEVDEASISRRLHPIHLVEHRPWRRVFAGDGVPVERVRPQPVHRCVQHGDHQMLARGLTALAGEQRRRDRLRRSGRGRFVTDQCAHEIGHRVLLRDLGRYDTADALDDRVVDAPVAVRAVGSEAADRHIDEPRVHGVQVGRTDAHPINGTGPEVLDDDVGLRSESLQRGHAIRMAEVERDRMLATVRRREHGRDRADPIRADPGQITDPMRLDLDDLSALVGQDLAAERPRDDGRQVQDFDALQWTSHDSCPPATCDLMIDANGHVGTRTDG